MISSFAIVPSAPLLLPEYAGRADCGAQLRALAVAAVEHAAVGADQIVLVHATDRDPRHTRSALGLRVGAHLVAGAGRRITSVAVQWDAPVSVCREHGSAIGAGESRVGLVVVADGCARRGEKAPGYLDERSFGYDREWLVALGGVEPELSSPAEMVPAAVRGGVNSAGLLALDAEVGADLLCHGRAPLQVLGGALARATASHGGTAGRGGTARRGGTAVYAIPPGQLWVGDPFGVRYVVAAGGRIAIPTAASAGISA